MKVCRIAREELVFLGIGPYDDVHKKVHYNKLIFLYILLIATSTVQTTAYLILEAKTFDEITQCIYIMSASILNPVALGSIAIQRNLLFELLQRIEDIMDSSK